MEGLEDEQDDEYNYVNNSDCDEIFEVMDKTAVEKKVKSRRKMSLEESKEKRKKLKQKKEENITEKAGVGKKGKGRRKKTGEEGEEKTEKAEKIQKKVKGTKKKDLLKGSAEKGIDENMDRSMNKRRKMVVHDNNDDKVNDNENETEGNKFGHLKENNSSKTKKRKRKVDSHETSTKENGEVEKTCEVKKKKRRSSEKNGLKEKSKKAKQSKLVSVAIDEDLEDQVVEDVPIGYGREQCTPFGDDHEQDMTIGDEEVLIEGGHVEDTGETSLTQDLEVTNTTQSHPEIKSNLNPKNVFQIEDLGEENDLLDYTVGDCDSEIHVHRMTIQEAFVNDDVIEEFVKEKANVSEARKGKDLDLSLPGWGDWGGPGIDETKRKKKFTVTAKPTPPGKDASLAHVIINEDRDRIFAKNQVISGLLFQQSAAGFYCIEAIA